MLAVLQSHDERLRLLGEQLRTSTDSTSADATARSVILGEDSQYSKLRNLIDAPGTSQTSSSLQNRSFVESDPALITKEEFLRHFRDVSFNVIEGWTETRILPLLEYYDHLHHKLGERGGAVEIGVHHGKFFIALNLFCDPDETSVAIDVFDSQQLNIDRSGSGDLAAFQANLQQYCRHSGRNVQIMPADSTRLLSAQILSMSKMKPRFFSIDGGHTAEHTLSDLTLAKECISPAGVIFVDDILNVHWLGVIEVSANSSVILPALFRSQSG
jgi:hypothetical protein